MSDRTTVCADCGYPVRLVHRFPDGVEPDDYESHSALASQPEPAVTEALRRILDAIDHGDLSHDDYETGRAALSAATPQPDDCIDCTHPWREHTDARCARAECRCTEPNPAKPAPSPAPAAEPSTETGQQLLAHHGDGTWFTLGRDDLRRAILIIEAEAGILGWNRRAASDREIAEASEQEEEDA